MLYSILLIGSYIVVIFISGIIGKSKGRTALGYVLGILSGPLGILIILFIPEEKMKKEMREVKNRTAKKCQYCAEIIKIDAIVCKYCGRQV